MRLVLFGISCPGMDNEHSAERVASTTATLPTTPSTTPSLYRIDLPLGPKLTQTN